MLDQNAVEYVCTLLGGPIGICYITEIFLTPAKVFVNGPMTCVWLAASPTKGYLVTLPTY